jgi:hypothetical protein
VNIRKLSVSTKKQITMVSNIKSVKQALNPAFLKQNHDRKEIAAPAIEKHLDKIEYVYFDIRDYDKILRNADKEDDKKLIALYKYLSPVHLLEIRH